MYIKELLSYPMKAKPDNNRTDRYKTSTPHDIIRLNYNENSFGMSPKAERALVNCAKNCFMYQDFYAIDLKESLADLHHLSKDNIITGCGSSSIIDMIGSVFLNSGDEVVYCSPTFGAYLDMTMDNGGIPIEVPLDASYCFDLESMYKKINERTKIAVICNPNNPTGTCVKADEIRKFIQKVPNHVLVMIDEAYIQYLEDSEEESMIHLIQENSGKPIIVLRTFSKIYGLAGVRIGYGVADSCIIDELMKTCQSWNQTYAGERAAIAALSDPEYIEKVRTITAQGRIYIEENLKTLGCHVIPSSTNFIYFSSPLSPMELEQELYRYHVLISSFAFSRVTVGTMQENKIFIHAMQEILKK